ncbi:DUF6247 family protein [Streptomyces yangpuensis]|uniref:DUF6247 family protein n=1 Tax=Streptomyces yangpuensis TaxID=1648182 RepID=UPI0036650A6C
MDGFTARLLRHVRDQDAFGDVARRGAADPDRPEEPDRLETFTAHLERAHATPYAPAPGAPAELLAQLRAHRSAERWVPAFEGEWAAAPEESRRTFSLTTLYEVVHVWQARLASAPAADAFVASGRDENGFVDMAELRGRLRR